VATRAEIEAYIRQAAAARGLDPDFAVRVSTGESGLNPAAQNLKGRDRSYGLWQLNMLGGLGVEAAKRGIDARNPEQWRQQTDFALDQAKKSWQPWTVARNLMKDPSAVVPPRRPDGAPGPRDAPSVPVLPTNVDKGILASIYEPFKKLAAEQKEQRVEQQLAEAQALIANPPQAAPQPMMQPAPAAPPPDFSALMFPRIRRGLLSSSQDYGGLLG
jgi:hypothetical protein